MDNGDLTNLFLLGRLQQGSRQEAIAIEQLNLLRAHQGLPPYEQQPMIDGVFAKVFWWCFKITMWGFIGMLVLFAIGFVLALAAFVLGIGQG